MKLLFIIFLGTATLGTSVVEFDDPPSQSKQPDKRPQPSEAQQEINRAYAELMKDLGDKYKRMMETKDPKEKEKLMEEIGQASSNRLWPIIQKYPDDRMSFMQLLGCVSSGHKEAAVFLFDRFDMKDTAIGDSCLSLGIQNAMRMDRLCEVVMNRTKNPGNRARACLGLAYWLGKEGAKLNEEGQPQAAKDHLDRAEQRFQQAIKEHGDVKLDLGPIQGTQTIKALAERSLFELRHLAIGKPAPDLAGQDLDGKPLALKDYRGKVVMVSFWAHWCGPCIAFIPQERKLVERLAGKPFALLGVNGDEPTDETREKTKKLNITWRSFQNQPTDKDQKISDAWNVITWPTIYLIDHQGIIRKKWIGLKSEKDLDRAVDELIDKVAK